MKRIIMLGSALATLVCALHGAAPTISWITKPRFPAANAYYTVQAQAHDADNNLQSMAVWRDGILFASNGTQDGGISITSSGNVYAEPNGTVHVFKAQATDSSGNQSPIIYWITKVGGNSIGFTDLQIVNSNSSERLFPNTDDKRDNALIYQEIVASLTASTTTRTLWFGPGRIDFDTNAGRSAGNPSPNMLLSFQGTKNLTIRGQTPNAATTLKWASFDNSGNLSTPHDLLRFEKDCDTITIRDLTFDTFYSGQMGTDGSHVKYRGNNFHMVNCWLWNAPGFAVVVGRDSPNTNGIPDGVNIEANVIPQTFMDGIHITTARNVWIVGNTVQNTGDDAIALIGFNGTTEPFTENFHILSNTITNSGWRGIAVHRSRGTDANRSEINQNAITGTAKYAIEVTPFDSADAGGTVASQDRPIWINILGNSITGAGSANAHLHPNEATDGVGLKLIDCVNVMAAQNSVNGVKKFPNGFGNPSTFSTGYAFETRNPLYVWIGFSDWTSNATYRKNYGLEVAHIPRLSYLYSFNSSWTETALPDTPVQ